MTERNNSDAALAICRFLFLLGLAVWLGGLAFVAIGAPAMFKVNRQFGPQMVGAAMGSFTVVTYFCAGLIVVGWIGEKLLGGRQGSDRAWTVQGVCIAVMIAIAVYLGGAVMPEMVSLQPTVVAQSNRTGQSVSPTDESASSSVKTRFDEIHKTYRTMTSSTVLFGLTTLFLFCLRISRTPSIADDVVALREGSIFTKGAI